jgi:hypothetical protein
VDREERFRDCLYFGEVEVRRGSVADSDDGSGVKRGVGDEIVVRRG